MVCGWKVTSGWGRVSALGGCGGQRTLSRNRGRERMDGARVEGRFGVGEGVRFDGGASLPGGAEKPSTNETTNKRMDEVARFEYS